MDKNKQPIKNRVSVVERLYFQNHIDKESPRDYGTKFSVNVDSDEQPYQRDLKASEEWAKVDFGWLNLSPGMFQVENSDRVTTLELAYAVPVDGSTVPLETLKAVNQVYPLASVRSALAANVELYIRSQASTVKYTVTVFPK